MTTTRRFVGEGQLTVLETLGGRTTLVPVVRAALVVVGLAALAALGGASWSSWAPALAAGAFAAWLGWKSGLLRALVSVLRGAPRPSWRVELDELTIRQVGANDVAQDFDWFEVERYSPAELGLVLWLRIPKNGVNAILLPKRFFAAEDWDSLVALVREKLPSSAKANDAAPAPRPTQWRKTLVLWIVLVVVLFTIYQIVKEP